MQLSGMIGKIGRREGRRTRVIDLTEAELDGGLDSDYEEVEAASRVEEQTWYEYYVAAH